MSTRDHWIFICLIVAILCNWIVIVSLIRSERKLTRQLTNLQRQYYERWTK